MQTFRIMIQVQRANQASADKFGRALTEALDVTLAKSSITCADKPVVSAAVAEANPATSRSARYSEAQSLVSDAKSSAEVLRDELQNWRDNLPENVQSGSKADALDEAIGNLEQFISNCEEAEGTDVEFPGMFG